MRLAVKVFATVSVDNAIHFSNWPIELRGFDTAPDFYPASTFASTFNRPDIVKAALDI